MFVTPEVNVVKFEQVDVIAASTPDTPSAPVLPEKTFDD